MLTQIGWSFNDIFIFFLKRKTSNFMLSKFLFQCIPKESTVSSDKFFVKGLYGWSIADIKIGSTI